MDDIVTAIRAANKLYLSGPFGSRKTTYGIERIRSLLQRERTRGDDILVLVPQLPQAKAYRAFLRGPDAPPGPPVRLTTLAGLARSAVELYWPLIAPSAGFASGKQEPTFLNLETAQYHMAPLVDRGLASGDFDGIRVERNRIISQVLDNLNKAAMHGFTIEEAYARLELAVPLGETRTARINALRASLRISRDFRQLCLDHALVDFSLQVELFSRHILVNDWSRTHLLRTHRHLIVDNAEEQNAVTHDLVRQWLPELESALIIVDEDAGYRLFMGADREGAESLAELCDLQLRVDAAGDQQPALRATAIRVDRASRSRAQAPTLPPELTDLPPAFVAPAQTLRFYPQMLHWVIDQVTHLVREEGIEPGNIAIVATFVSDALLFRLQNGMTDAGIDLTTHRPSRALQDEPAARSLLTWAALAHPHWEIRPAQSDVAQALLQSIPRLDPVRASLLTNIVYPLRRSTLEITPFGALQPEMQARITFGSGEAYDRLRDWLYAYRSSDEILPLDQFFARLFGELLSQPGFGFHLDYDAARIANQLVESARNFRWALEGSGPQTPNPSDLGKAYLGLINSGALGALFAPGWQEPQDAVFLAPAYTFLMRNRTVDVQFWLDAGSTGWWERLYQPLTHPHVLSRSWPADQPWTDLDEYQTRQETMRRVLLGLIRRTRRRIYLGISDYGESGFEQRGALLNVINQVLAQAS